MIHVTTRRKRGFALVGALAAIFLLSILGLAVASMSAFNARMSKARHSSTTAFDLAEAGFRHAVKSLAEDKEYAGQQATAFGDGTFIVTVSEPQGNSTQREIQSTGTVNGPNGRIARKTVSGVVDIETESNPGTDYAILADDLIEFSGNATVRSAPETNEGHIHTNGTLKVSGNPAIYGEGSVVGSYNLSGSPYYHGGLHTAAAPVSAPWPDFNALKAQAYAAGTHSGDLTIQGTTEVTLRGRITGKLSIKDSARVTIDGPVWVNQEADLQGNVQIRGNGAIICEKKMSLGGQGGFTNDPEIDNSLMLASMLGPSDTVAVDIGGPVRVKAAIYAPNGKINLSGALDIWGLLRAKRVYLSGDAEVIKNTSYTAFDTVPSISVKVKYWRED